MIFNFKDGPALTKEMINEYVSDQQIYEFYLEEEINFSKKYKSPFRTDNNPSLSFLVLTDGTILYRDWGDPLQSKSYGVVYFVMKMKGDCTYMEALYGIVSDMSLPIKLDKPYIKKNVEVPKKRKITPSNTNEKKIIVDTQPFTTIDVAYWYDQYKISMNILKEYYVYSVRHVWIEDEKGKSTLVRKYTKNNPVYAYAFGKWGGLDRWKIYTPYAPKGNKWLSNANGNIMQGLTKLNYKNPTLIITKSLKDVMVLNRYGFNSVATQSEGTPIPDWFQKVITRFFSDTFIFYDNDEVGIRESKKLAKEHGFREISIPKMINAKDISDFTKNYGQDKARLFMENTINGFPYSFDDLPF